MAHRRPVRVVGSGVRLLRDSGRTRLRWSQSRYASCWVFSAIRCTDLRGTRCTQVLERAASVEPLAAVEGDRREGVEDHRALPAGDVRRPCCAAADTLSHYNLLIMFNASIVTQRAAKLSPTMRAAFASLMLSPSPVDRTVTVLMPIRAASQAHVHGKACETPAINLYVTVVTVHLPPAAPLTCANDPQCHRWGGLRYTSLGLRAPTASLLMLADATPGGEARGRMSRPHG